MTIEDKIEEEEEEERNKSRLILKYLKLTGIMNFMHATRNLVEQIADPFYELQVMEGFDVLQRRVKVLVALERLRCLTERNVNLFIGESQNGLHSILKKKM